MSNNPFESHNIEYLSATSINEFITNPARWVLTYVGGYRDTFGSPAMWRGIAVDDVICKAVYENISIKQCKTLAKEIFDTKMEEAKTDNINYDIDKASKERDLLSSYIDVAIPHFRELGKPLDTQKRIVLEFDFLPIPIIGYTDLQYEGVVRDIKTVNRLPTKMLDTVSRQLSIYAAAENCIPIIDYVHVTQTKQQVVTTPVQNLEVHINEVKRACLNMMNVLSYSNDVNGIAELFFPNFDDWKWSSKEKQEAKKLWRI